MNAPPIIFPSLLEAPPQGSGDHPGSDLVRGSDGKLRPAWVGSDPVLEGYYDNEWGRPLTDEQGLFELQSLLVFQAGLRWKSILVRRSRLKAALQGFSVGYLSLLGDADVERLAQDERMIKNRQKIKSVIANAKAVRALDGRFAELVWSFQPEYTPCPVATRDLPDRIPESEAMAAALKDHGFTFVGPKSCFAFMQAAGIVDGNPLEAANRGVSGLWHGDGRRVRIPVAPAVVGT